MCYIHTESFRALKLYVQTSLNCIRHNSNRIGFYWQYIGTTALHISTVSVSSVSMQQMNKHVEYNV